jgi:hypothetical protein
MRKFFIPPLSVPLLTVLLGICFDVLSPPEGITDKFDNIVDRPIPASQVFLILSPFIYGIAVITNALDEFLSRLTPRHKWISTVALVLLSWTGLVMLLFDGSGFDSSFVMIPLFLAALFFVPPALVRHLLQSKAARQVLNSVSAINEHFKASYQVKFESKVVITLGAILLLGFVYLLIASRH